MTRSFFQEWGKQDDCVQYELNTAIDFNKVIIPIEVAGSFQGIPTDLPEKIKNLFNSIHFSRVHNDQSFERDLQDIVTNRIRAVVERCRDERRRGVNEIKKAYGYLWGVNNQPRDISKAFQIFLDVYKEIPYMSDALVGIGKCLRAQNQFKEAIGCFEQAGEKGNGEGYYLTGQCYEESGASPMVFRKYYDLSAELDYAPAWIEKGLEAKELKEIQRALSCFKRAAELEDSDGIYQSALIYEDIGQVQKAFNLIREAIDHNNPAAMNHLGMLYYQGKNFKKDDKLAFSLISRAADMGFTLAMFNKGCMLYDGVGVKKDKRLGKKWLEAAAQKGSKIARERLQQM